MADHTILKTTRTNRVLFVAQKNPDYDSGRCLWPLPVSHNNTQGCLSWMSASTENCSNKQEWYGYCFCSGQSKPALWNKGCGKGFYHSRLLAEITTVGNDPRMPGITTQLRTLELLLHCLLQRMHVKYMTSLTNMLRPLVKNCSFSMKC